MKTETFLTVGLLFGFHPGSIKASAVTPTLLPDVEGRHALRGHTIDLWHGDFARVEDLNVTASGQACQKRNFSSKPSKAPVSQRTIRFGQRDSATGNRNSQEKVFIEAWIIIPEDVTFGG
jgi:hypothetical protein